MKSSAFRVTKRFAAAIAVLPFNAERHPECRNPESMSAVNSRLPFEVIYKNILEIQ
jgi:hypothetical protein